MCRTECSGRQGKIGQLRFSTSTKCPNDTLYHRPRGVYPLFSCVSNVLAPNSVEQSWRSINIFMTDHELISIPCWVDWVDRDCPSKSASAEFITAISDATQRICIHNIHNQEVTQVSQTGGLKSAGKGYPLNRSSDGDLGGGPKEFFAEASRGQGRLESDVVSCRESVLSSSFGFDSNLGRNHAVVTQAARFLIVSHVGIVMYTVPLQLQIGRSKNVINLNSAHPILKTSGGRTWVKAHKSCLRCSLRRFMVPMLQQDWMCPSTRPWVEISKHNLWTSIRTKCLHFLQEDLCLCCLNLKARWEWECGALHSVVVQVGAEDIELLTKHQQVRDNSPFYGWNQLILNQLMPNDSRILLPLGHLGIIYLFDMFAMASAGTSPDFRSLSVWQHLSSACVTTRGQPDTGLK